MDLVDLVERSTYIFFGNSVENISIEGASFCFIVGKRPGNSRQHPIFGSFLLLLDSPHSSVASLLVKGMCGMELPMAVWSHPLARIVMSW